MLGLFYLGLAVFFRWLKKQLDKIDLSGVKVPILTYPDCELCECNVSQPTQFITPNALENDPNVGIQKLITQQLNAMRQQLSQWQSIHSRKWAYIQILS